MINEFWMSHHTWLPLIKVAGVRSLGKSRVDHSKHPPQSWVRTAPLPTHHAPKLHTWLLSWGASASLPHPANKARTQHFTERKYSNTGSARTHAFDYQRECRSVGMHCMCTCTSCKYNSECSLKLVLPVVVFQSSDATGQSPILSISFSSGWESRCSIRPAGKMPQIQHWF